MFGKKYVVRTFIAAVWARIRINCFFLTAMVIRGRVKSDVQKVNSCFVFFYLFFKQIFKKP